MQFWSLRCLVLTCSLGLFAAPTEPAQPNTKPQGVIPFHSIEGIIPGLTRYSAIKRIYGEPKDIEVSKVEVVAGVKVGGTRVIHYRRMGISFVLESGVDPTVDAIYVEAPYKGRTPNGLFLGMEKGDALKIIERDYFISQDLGESLLVARSEKHSDSFQVWFADGRLIRMKVFSS